MENKKTLVIKVWYRQTDTANYLDLFSVVLLVNSKAMALKIVANE